MREPGEEKAAAPAEPGPDELGEVPAIDLDAGGPGAPMPNAPTDHSPRGAAGVESLMSWLPGLRTLRGYQPAWLPRDVIAGLVLTALLVPAGMGYAEAAGLPAILGLYATIVPLLAYALLGPSRILVLGPDSSLVPLIAAAIVPLAAGDEARATSLAGTLAILAGLLVAGAGLARFGFLTDLLSTPVRQGYLNGIALIVLVGQLGKVFGFSLDGETLLEELASWVAGLRDGQTDWVALAIGATCLVVILGFRAWRPSIPGVLVAVVGATVVSGVLDLANRTGIVVLGPLPQGLPQFSIPTLDPGDVAALLPAAIGIALVSAADTSVLSRAFAARGGYQVDANRELFALGASSGVSGFFSGFPVSSSSSRTPVAEASGAKTQLTGVVGALAVVALLVFAPSLLSALPQATLGAVVMAAALSLVDTTTFRRLWARRRSEFWLAFASFAGVAFIGVIPGIFIAVGLSLLAFLRRAWWPHDAVLGRAQGVKGYHDLAYYPDARQIPGLVLYRFDGPLFFANADVFRARVLDRARAARPPARWVVVAAEPITDIDTTAAEMIEDLLLELEGMGVTLAFAELKDFVKDRLRRYGTLARIGEDHCYPTVGRAVDAYLTATGEEWIDWEEAGIPPRT
jgi:high affinity sulfate transporter 1